MIPGQASKSSESVVAAATTIYPKTDIIHVTDTASTTVFTTIVPPYAGFSGSLLVINRSGASMTTVTTGNIQTAVTVGQNVATVLAYSKLLDKWVPGALA
jgi:hypothetical protein